MMMLPERTTLLTEARKTAIRKLWKELKDNLILEESGLLDVLYANEVVNDRIKDDIMVSKNWRKNNQLL